jgi:cell division protein FtsW (lipid II flippase)
MMEFSSPSLPRWFLLCAPIPALILGITAMRQAGVPTAVWLTNVAAACAGLLLVVVWRRPRSARTRTQLTIAAAAIAAILLPFVSGGMMGVHRWVSVGGFSLQSSAIVAPLIVTCIAAIARWHTVGAIAIAVLTTSILALQPDAAQATSFAVACSVLLAFDIERRRRQVIIGVALLLIAAMMSFTQQDRLPPVAHVEEIYALVASRGVAWAALGAAALLLLPLPFFALFARSRDRLTLALAAYVAMTVLAPFWDTFPVPVMGYGASHILGYFIALAACSRASAGAAVVKPTSSPVSA